MTGKERNIAAWAQSSWDEVAAFIGPNAERFRSAYDKGREKGAKSGAGIALTWSWAGLVFSFAWFAYRKLWLMAAAAIILPLALGELNAGGGALLGLVVAIATLSKSVYVQHAVTKIARIKAEGGGRAEIAAAGGVSMAGGIVGGAL